MAKGLKELNKDGAKTSGYRISIPISFMTTFVFTLVVLILIKGRPMPCLLETLI